MNNSLTTLNLEHRYLVSELSRVQAQTAIFREHFESTQHVLALLEQSRASHKKKIFRKTLWRCHKNLIRYESEAQALLNTLTVVDGRRAAYRDFAAAKQTIITATPGLALPDYHGHHSYQQSHLSYSETSSFQQPINVEYPQLPFQISRPPQINRADSGFSEHILHLDLDADYFDAIDPVCHIYSHDMLSPVQPCPLGATEEQQFLHGRVALSSETRHVTSTSDGSALCALAPSFVPHVSLDSHFVLRENVVGLGRNPGLRFHADSNTKLGH